MTCSRWLAPEAVSKRTYSSKSDGNMVLLQFWCEWHFLTVWSFAVTVIEILERSPPYPGMPLGIYCTCSSVKWQKWFQRNSVRSSCKQHKMLHLESPAILLHNSLHCWRGAFIWILLPDLLLVISPLNSMLLHYNFIYSNKISLQSHHLVKPPIRLPNYCNRNLIYQPTSSVVKTCLSSQRNVDVGCWNSGRSKDLEDRGTV